MKWLLSKLGTVGLYMFMVLLLICLLPLILPALIIFGSAHLYGVFWARIRHDPKVNIHIPELDNLEIPEEDSINAYETAFDDACQVIKRYTQSRLSTIRRDDDEQLSELSKDNDVVYVTLQRTIKTQVAEAELNLRVRVNLPESGGRTMYALDQMSDDWHAPILPISVKMLKPYANALNDYTLRSSDDVWMLIGLLRGDVKFTRFSSQPWVYLPEHKLWIVRYKDNNSMGLRHKFTGLYAREYSRDTVDDAKFSTKG